jgi:hypothetical protein
MSAFDPDADLSGDVAFRLIAASFVRLFRRPALLDQAIGWLLDHNYQVVRLNASGWTREEDLHEGISQALGFPDYYGRNLDALSDCLSDVCPVFRQRPTHALQRSSEPLLTALQHDELTDGGWWSRHTGRSVPGPGHHSYRATSAPPAPPDPDRHPVQESG